jgi:hypothetical protein
MKLSERTLDIDLAGPFDYCNFTQKLRLRGLQGGRRPVKSEVLGVAIFEGRHCSFQNVHYCLIDFRILNRTRCVLHRVVVGLVEIGVNHPDRHRKQRPSWGCG